MKKKNLPVQETVKLRASNQQVGGAQRKLSISPQAAGSGSTDPHEACPQPQHPVSSTVTSVFKDRQSKMSSTVDQVLETVEPSCSSQQVGGVQRKLYISPQAAGSGTTDLHEACPQIHPVSSTVTDVFTDRWFEMSTMSTIFDLVQEAEEPMTSSQQVGGAQLRLSISPQAAGSGSPHEACPQTYAVSSTATKAFTGPQSKMSTIDSKKVEDLRVNDRVNESLTDKQTSKKEEGCKAFFQRKLRALKSGFKFRRGNKVEPLNIQLNASLDDKRADNVPGLDDAGLNDHQTDARDLAAHEPNAIRAQPFVKRGNKAEPLTLQLNAQLKKTKKRADAHPGPSGFGITDHNKDAEDPAAQTLSPSAFRAVPGPCDAAGLMLAKPESSDQKWAEFVSELRLAEALSTLEAVTKTSSADTDTVKSAVPEPSPLPGPSQLGQIPDTYLVDPNPGKDKYSSLYKLGKKLGEGYYGRVYKGTRKSDGQKVAIKFVKKLKSDVYIDIPGHPKPLETEVALNVLMSKPPRSPYVLPMYQWFDEPKRRVLILKYPNPCESVKTFISRHGGCVSEEMARDIIIQAVYGAKHCLQRGVFHLDITLDNMLINKKTLNLQFIDFGVGQYVGNDVDIDEEIEEPLPKDFYRRRRYLLENTTVFSIGAMMYEILHGRPPKRTVHGNDLILKSSLSKECCDLLAQCLNRKTLERPHIKQIINHEWFKGTERREELQEPAETTPEKKNIWKKLNKFFTHTKKATEKPLVPEPSPVPAQSQTPDTYLCDPKPAKGKFTSRYKLGERLGEGGFGKVFEGIRKSDGKKVAIKIVKKMPVNNRIEVPGHPEPLETEIGLNVLLSKHPRCPYVLPMYQWYNEPKRRILVLEHPHPCETLSSFMMRNGGRVSEAVARDLIIQALRGAKHCLERGVFHQDISLSNLLINTETLRLKLIDFGVGQHVDTSVDINELLGKPSPFEFSKRCRYLAELTTVWDLGTVLYEMLHGYHPRSEEGCKKKFHPSLSKECVDLLTQCLNRNRMLRPSVQQVIDHEWFRGIEPQEEPQESAELSPVKKEKGRRSANITKKLRKVFRKKERKYNLQ